MKKVIILAVFILVTIMVKPCTTFTFKNSEGHVFFGRNYDFPSGVGMVNINQKGMTKEAFVQPPEEKLNWQSRYGSISFNQIGREFPYGGMNEAGLVIEQMWLRETKYPEMDHRFGLTELQWIQYHLDMSANVQEVIDSDSLLRISTQSVATLHFLVADEEGNTAVIEFLEGKMQVYQKADLPYTVLANCPYRLSVDFTESNEKTDEASFSGWTQNSSGRFANAAQNIESYRIQEPVDFAYNVLDSVAQEGSTQWSIVYDIENRRIYVKTQENTQIRKIEMSDFCFNAGCLEKIHADIHSSLSVTDDFAIYSYQENFNLLNNVCEKVEFLNNSMSDQVRKATAEYSKVVMKNNR